jgi:uncharacterized protein YfiM (DUF2279 family)
MPFPKAEHVDMQPHALHLDKSAGRRMGGLEPRYAEMGRRCEHGKEQGDNGEIKQDHRDQGGHRTLPAPRDEHSGTITGRSFGGSRGLSAAGQRVSETANEASIRSTPVQFHFACHHMSGHAVARTE